MYYFYYDYKKIILIILIPLSYTLQAQFKAGIIQQDTLIFKNHTPLKIRHVLIPTFLIGYGVLGIGNDQLKSFNTQIREEVQENIDKKITIDDFSQYTPLASVYILNAFGIQGKNNFKDRTLILATSYLIMGFAVNSLKHTLKVERPDASGFTSFPSGHTATAFMGAEFLYQEYKEVSIWYGIPGYLIAAGTGTFRMYNNKHWLNDVVAGAGIGIMSTKTAYWLCPIINELLTSKNNRNNNKTAFIPYYDGKQVGFGLVSKF